MIRDLDVRSVLFFLNQLSLENILFKVEIYYIHIRCTLLACMTHLFDLAFELNNMNHFI